MVSGAANICHAIECVLVLLYLTLALARSSPTFRRTSSTSRYVSDAKLYQLQFQNAFDQKQALSSGVIVPRKGVVPEYDQALDKVVECEQALEQYLDDQRSHFKSRVRHSKIFVMWILY